MLKFILHLFGRNGNSKAAECEPEDGEKAVTKKNVSRKSQKIVIDLRMINGELDAALKASESKGTD